MIIKNGSDVKTIYTTLKADFQKGIEEAEPTAKPLYQVVPSSGESNLYGWFQHIPGFKRWIDGQPRIKRNLTQQSLRVPNARYEDTIAISVDAVNDDQLAQYRPAIQAMGKVGTLLEDELVYDLFNYGFTGTTADGDDVRCYDGQPWFSNSHQVGESIIDNYMTDALSATSYEAAYTTLLGFKAKADKLSTARPLNRTSNKLLLVVPTALIGTAKEIVGVQLTTGGATNKWYGTADILVSPYLTSSTAWFLVNVGEMIKPIFFQDREKLQIIEKTPTNDTEAFTYDEIIVGAKRRCAALVTMPWLAIGSDGTT